MSLFHLNIQLSTTQIQTLHPTLTPPTSASLQINISYKSLKAEAMLDIMAERCRQLIAVVPIFHFAHSLSAARLSCFLLVLAVTNPLIGGSFDDRSRFALGLSPWRYYMLVGDT